MDVTRPEDDPVLLATGPDAADEVNDVPLPGGLLTFIKGLGVVERVDIAELEGRTLVVAEVVEVVHEAVLRFRFVEPEHPHAIVVVVLLSLVPDVLAGTRISGVEEGFVAHEVVRILVHPFGPDEVALIIHLVIIFTIDVDGRPDGNHQLDPHLL